MTWTLAVLGLLTLGAAARLTRLITADTITQPLRTLFARRADQAHLDALEAKRTKNNPQAERVKRLEKRTDRRRIAVEFINCDWCVGFWICVLAFAALFAYLVGAWPWDYTAREWFLYAASALTGSWLVGTLAENLPLSHGHDD